MGDREEWRFQWPDGTWIHWNPRTQSWEKETDGGSEAPSAAPFIASEPQPEPHPEPEPEVDFEPDPETAPEPEPVVGPDAEEKDPPRVAEAVTTSDDGAEVIAEEAAQPARDREPSRARRSMVGDVLPPRDEPDRPGGSLWPTILAGAVVGVGVGLLLWSLIR